MSELFIFICGYLIMRVCIIFLTYCMCIYLDAEQTRHIEGTQYLLNECTCT